MEDEIGKVETFAKSHWVWLVGAVGVGALVWLVFMRGSGSSASVPASTISTTTPPTTTTSTPPVTNQLVPIPITPPVTSVTTAPSLTVGSTDPTTGGSIVSGGYSASTGYLPGTVETSPSGTQLVEVGGGAPVGSSAPNPYSTTQQQANDMVIQANNSGGTPAMNTALEGLSNNPRGSAAYDAALSSLDQQLKIGPFATKSIA